MASIFPPPAAFRLSSNAAPPLRKLVLDFRKFFSPLLTDLYLWGNNMGETGEKAVRDAVKDRSGFELVL